MPTHVSFPLCDAPEEYLHPERIERIWKGLLELPRDMAVSIHVCPMRAMYSGHVLGSTYFLAPGHAADPCPPPADAPAPHGKRMWNTWEGERPHALPSLTLSCSPVPERPAETARRLAEATGERLDWHIPYLPSFFNNRDTSVLIPVDAEFVPSPRKAALAWQWLDAFLLRVRDTPPEGLPLDGTVDILGTSYRFTYRERPEHYRVERLMSLYPKPENFFAPGEGFHCPVCGGCPDDEAMLESLQRFDEDSLTPTGWQVTAPCCGTVMPFNAFENTWLGFARFALETAFVACRDEDLAELGELMETPFKVIYTHL